MKCDNKKIAEELIKTALNKSYFGSALYAAKDMETLTESEKAVIHRYLNGTQSATDHIALQDIANKISREPQP